MADIGEEGAFESQPRVEVLEVHTTQLNQIIEENDEETKPAGFWHGRHSTSNHATSDTDSRR